MHPQQNTTFVPPSVLPRTGSQPGTPDQNIQLDASGNGIQMDASGNSVQLDASGNGVPIDASKTTLQEEAAQHNFIQTSAPLDD
jgi:hypothetical protein